MATSMSDVCFFFFHLPLLLPSKGLFGCWAYFEKSGTSQLKLSQEKLVGPVMGIRFLETFPFILG